MQCFICFNFSFALLSLVLVSCAHANSSTGWQGPRVAMMYAALLKRLAGTPARASPPIASMSRAEAVLSRLQALPIPRASPVPVVPVVSIVATQKRKYKEDSRTTVKSCTFLLSQWRKGRAARCCTNTWCNASLTYSVDAILGVRLHLADKTLTEMKSFVMARVDKVESEADGSMDLSGGDRKRARATYWMEKESLLAARLKRTTSTLVFANELGRRLTSSEKPEFDDRRRVCQNFLMFAAGTKSSRIIFSIAKTR